MVKNLPAKEEDEGLISGIGRSSGEANATLLHYSCLGDPMDRGAWWATSMGWQRVRHDSATKQLQQCYPSDMKWVIPSRHLCGSLDIEESYKNVRKHDITEQNYKNADFKDTCSFSLFSSVQFRRSVMSDCSCPPRTAAHQASLSITNSWSLLKLTSIMSVMPYSSVWSCVK